VDHLELIVRDGKLYEKGKAALVEELLEITERHLHLVGRRGHEDRVVERVPPDPYRAGPQVAGPTVLAPYPLKKMPMQFPEQAHGDRKALCNPAKSVLHGHDVVADLSGVVGVVGRLLARLEKEELIDVGLGALDARAEYCFQSEVWPDEKVGIRDEPTYASQSVDRSGRFVEQPHNLV
jgi:hypothetical protein